jgi:hypothetical protein
MGTTVFYKNWQDYHFFEKTDFHRKNLLLLSTFAAKILRGVKNTHLATFGLKNLLILYGFFN